MLSYAEVLRRAFSGEVIHLEGDNAVRFFTEANNDTTDRHGSGLLIQLDTLGECIWVSCNFDSAAHRAWEQEQAAIARSQIDANIEHFLGE